MVIGHEAIKLLQLVVTSHYVILAVMSRIARRMSHIALVSCHVALWFLPPESVLLKQV